MPRDGWFVVELRDDGLPAVVAHKDHGRVPLGDWKFIRDAWRVGDHVYPSYMDRFFSAFDS